MSSHLEDYQEFCDNLINQESPEKDIDDLLINICQANAKDDGESVKRLDLLCQIAEMILSQRHTVSNNALGRQSVEDRFYRMVERVKNLRDERGSK